MRISETTDGSWKAEQECEEDGVIIYLAIKYHPLVNYVLGLLTTQDYMGKVFLLPGEKWSCQQRGATYNINFSWTTTQELTYIVVLHSTFII